MGTAHATPIPSPPASTFPRNTSAMGKLIIKLRPAAAAAGEPARAKPFPKSKDRELWTTTTVAAAVKAAPRLSLSALELAAAQQQELTRSSVLASTMADNQNHAEDFINHCRREGLPSPLPRERLSAVALASFFWTKARQNGNARSWKQWQAKTTSYFYKEWECPRLPAEDHAYLVEQSRVAKKTEGDNPLVIRPADDAKLHTLWERCRDALGKDVAALMTFRQLVIAKALTLRPEDHYVTDAGEPGDRIKVRDVTFHGPAPECGLPLGYMEIILRNTKGMKLTGRSKRDGELHIHGATGDALCPVAAAKAIFAAYGLSDPARADEFVFAAMRPDGQRKYSNPAGWTGAEPMSAREFNGRVADLCKLAGIARFTGKATRHGSSSDMLLQGVSERMSDVAGAWQKGSQVSYQRMSPALAGALLTARTKLRQDRILVEEALVQRK